MMTENPSKRGGLLLPAILAGLFAVALAGAAVTAAVSGVDPGVSRVGTTIILAVGAADLALLALAGFAGRSRPVGEANPAVRALIQTTLGLLGAGVLVGVVSAVIFDTASSALVALSSGLLVSVLVLLHLFWMTRRLR